jgi:hypothetical protein
MFSLSFLLTVSFLHHKPSWLQQLLMWQRTFVSSQQTSPPPLLLFVTTGMTHIFLLDALISVYI